MLCSSNGEGEDNVRIRALKDIYTSDNRMSKFTKGHHVREECMHTDRQTDRQTGD